MNWTIKILSTMAVLLMNAFANAQCNFTINNLPDTILACKNTPIALNPGLTIGGTAPYFLDTFWNTNSTISNPNIINPTINVATTSANYILTVQGVTPTNLITNGDFNAGNTVFTSAYVYGTGGSFGLLSNPGEYAISTNASLTHSNFANFGDHTTGTGNMMVVNGSSTANVDIWCQTIAVTPNTFYDFSAWGASCVASSPAILQFSINGTLIGTPLSLPTTTGAWTQFRATWFSGASTSINICIKDQSTAASGNDFAIDDIAFKQICNVTDSVYINVVNLTPAIQIIKKLGCSQDTVQFNSLNGVGNVPSNYYWSLGPGINSILDNPSQIYTMQGIYSIKLVTELNGCKDSVTSSVNTRHPLQAIFTIDDTSCLNVDVTMANTSIMFLPSTQTVDWGDGIVNILFNHTYTTPGIYNIILTIVDNLGCVDKDTQKIVILDAPFVALSALDSTVCQGDPVFFKDSVNQYTESTVWTFEPGTQHANLHNPIHTFELGNVYNVSVVAKNNKCPDVISTQVIYVTDYPKINLGPDTSICPYLTAPVVLNASLSFAATYLWNTNATSQTIISSDPGIYWLTGTTNDCSSTDSVFVKRDCFLNIPNSFTPDNDGQNEYFIPMDVLSSGLTSFSMNIFNRWGELIFNTTNVNTRGWDGKFGGKNQPVGSYVYQIEVGFKNRERKTYHGNVTLLR